MAFIDHNGNVAERKSGITGWKWARVEVVGDAFLYEGGAPRILTSGPRKGKPTWKGATMSKVIVTEAEVVAEHERHERETGRCAACDGDGAVIYSMSSDGTSKSRTCGRCKGVGLAPGATTMQPRAESVDKQPSLF